MQAPEARRLIDNVYATYTLPYFTQKALESLESLIPILGVEGAYELTLSHLYSRAALADYTDSLFNDSLRWKPGKSVEEYNDSLPAAVIVTLLFPHLPDATTQDLQTWLDSDYLSPLDLLHFRATLTDTPPLDSPALALALLEHPQIDSSDWLTLPDLGLPPLASQDVWWLVSLYVAAFNRAPEPAGLLYWATQLNSARLTETDASTTLQDLAAHFDASGRLRHEAGTQLNSTEYVAYLYQQVLGRAAEDSGLDYWAQAIDQGQLPAGHALAAFIYSASQSPGDAEYLQARVAVAAHATHTLLQHPEAKLDLTAILENVRDPVSALTTIASLARADSDPQSLAKHSVADDLDLWLRHATTDPVSDTTYDPGNIPDSRPDQPSVSHLDDFW